MILISGPCVIEGEEHCMHMALMLNNLVKKHDGIDFYFKASFDKANRTSLGGFRGVGMENGLRILQKVKDEIGCKVITDVHDVNQVGPVSYVCDAIQIPAFLSRQTDILTMAAASHLPVNIKKGQWTAPWDMKYAVEKVHRTRHPNDKSIPTWVTERGTTFGYNRNVVDMTGLKSLSRHAPVIIDCTHSIQAPGVEGGKSGGDRKLAPIIARAAMATGYVDGAFMEVHNNPDVALSDGPNSLTVEMFAGLLPQLLLLHEISRSWNKE